MKKNGVMTFKVLKGIPLPASKGGYHRKFNWPLGTMKVGECFFVPIESRDVIGVLQARNRVMKAIVEWRQTGRRFATRANEDRTHLGVWRIA